MSQSQEQASSNSCRSECSRLGKLFDLRGKVAVVTGGASGIGKAIACGLAEFGSDIGIVEKNYPGAQKVAEQDPKLR